MRRAGAALAFAALLGPAPGAALAADAPARWYVQVDNDVVFGTDRWYTSGVRIARVAGAGEIQVEWGVMQEVHTPEAEHWAPGVDDRAPTARLLAYGARHRLGPRFLETLELGLGVRGPSALGREATDAVHELVPAPEVDWSRQEGDRLDVQLAAVRSHAFDDFHVHYGAVAGNQLAFAHGGIEWRAGTGAARVALSPLLRHAATPPPPASAPPGWAAFAGAGVRAIARNAMVRRNYDGFGPELEPRRAVGRAAAGLAWVGAWGSATFALAVDTREFAQQRKPQAFGALTVHVEF